MQIHSEYCGFLFPSGDIQLWILELNKLIIAEELIFISGDEDQEGIIGRTESICKLHH
jgi:hypothetical protein